MCSLYPPGNLASPEAAGRHGPRTSKGLCLDIQVARPATGLPAKRLPGNKPLTRGQMPKLCLATSPWGRKARAGEGGMKPHEAVQPEPPGRSLSEQHGFHLLQKQRLTLSPASLVPGTGQSPPHAARTAWCPPPPHFTDGETEAPRGNVLTVTAS